ncbi:hypothetical protein RE474_09635 [Methanolobus sediminis]|uniref:Uncharacterized protein n=1 Tax=Methanolobus sediminis TaxID=3072978 RepID=A0AA51ULT1_9EURY|nr:hypothetical protein [Methanolobus sediminis]WMW24350.1 hypothetical protein RE474_09635 [Methanolobus sediminis]
MKYSDLSEEEHIKSIIRMSWYGIAAISLFVVAVGVLEWIF